MIGQPRALRLLLILVVGCVLASPLVQAQTKQAQNAKLTHKQAQDLLRTGYDALQADKARDAVEAFSKALQSGRLSSSEMAKTFYYRAQAYRSLKQPANAISDLNSALWMKDELSDKDRAEAVKMRSASYREAGVDNGESPSGDGAAGAQRPQVSGWQVDATQQAAAEQSDTTANTTSNKPVSSFFSNLFGSGQSKKETTADDAGNATTGASSWMAATQTVPSSPAAQSSPRDVSGAYTIQIASVRSEELARNIVRQVATNHTRFLLGRQPTVERQAVGNMGTFYHVRIRQWPSKQASRQLCKQLLETGLDCLVTN